MRKIKILSTFNAVKCGNVQRNFFDSNEFDITLEDNLFVKIINRRDGMRSYTSLFNVPFWDFEDGVLDVQSSDKLGGKRAKGKAKELESEQKQI